MHRIDAPGFAPGNLWTEGVPASSIPATTVGADWQNDLQEEIVNVILGQGITLIKGDQEQLREAIQSMISSGGVGSGIQQTILNNQAATSIAGLLFPSATTKGGSFEFDIERQTALPQNVIEHGFGIVSRDPVAGDWRIAISSQFDDTGVTFTITSAGQVQYASTDLSGASYAGAIRVTNIKATLNTVI